MRQEPKEFLKDLRQLLDEKVMEARGYRLIDGGREWEGAVKPSWLYFNLTEWIDKDDMSEEEKKEHPEYATIGGYLKVYGFQEAFQKSYNEAPREEQVKIKNLPNFNPDKFYQISGIRVDEAKKETILTDENGKKYRIKDVERIEEVGE